jgi:hypothetical protein
MQPAPEHCAAAMELLARLDADLAANAKRRGIDMFWETGDIEARKILADTMDRREKVQQLWGEATDPKRVVPLSNELRQLDSAVQRLLASIKTDIAEPESLTTIKARRAASTRWDKERARNAGI